MSTWRRWSFVALAGLILALDALGSRAGAVVARKYIDERINAAPFFLTVKIIGVGEMPRAGTRGRCNASVEVVKVDKSSGGLNAGQKVTVLVPCFTANAELVSCAFSLDAEKLTPGSSFWAAFNGDPEHLAMVDFSYNSKPRESRGEDTEDLRLGRIKEERLLEARRLERIAEERKAEERRLDRLERERQGAK